MEHQRGRLGLGSRTANDTGGGVGKARYLHVLMRHSDKVKMACRSNLANSYCGAIIETDPSGVLKRPSYLVMQLYARHAKPLPLRSDPIQGWPGRFCQRIGRQEITYCLLRQYQG